MFFRSQALGVVCAGLPSAAATGALAADQAPTSDFGTFSANTALTTDYVFRGISQSQEDPAVQGGFDWSKDIFYVGAWASSIDFSPTKAPLELDVYAGITPTLGPVSFNFGGIYYMYPGANDPKGGEFNFFELKASAEHDFGVAKASVSLNYSPDYFGESGDATFVEGKITVPLVENFEASAALGHQWIQKNAVFGTPDYLTWNAGVSYTWKQFTLDARYYDTDLSTSQCFGGPPKVCGARGVGTVSASF